MSAPLRITHRLVSGIAIVELEGRLVYDEDDERVLSECIKSLVAAGARSILVDLSRVTHMDSDSIGGLVSAHLHTIKRGGQFKLLQPSERVRRVLHMTKLEAIFDILETEAEALRAFTPAAVPYARPRGA